MKIKVTMAIGTNDHQWVEEEVEIDIGVGNITPRKTVAEADLSWSKVSKAAEDEWYCQQKHKGRFFATPGIAFVTMLTWIPVEEENKSHANP